MKKVKRGYSIITIENKPDNINKNKAITITKINILPKSKFL
jgi:hypothetical protein